MAATAPAPPATAGVLGADLPPVAGAPPLALPGVELADAPPALLAVMPACACMLVAAPLPALPTAGSVLLQPIAVPSNKKIVIR